MKQEQIPTPAPLVEVTRGHLVESRHRGHVAIVDADGQTIAQLGAPEVTTYLRSSAKPHQAVPLVASGAADRFNFTAREIAISCGSHSGESIHTQIVAAMLHKIGLDESALKCGTHEPFNREAAREMRERGLDPNVLQNNCSGKHAGMLALALHLGADTKSYDAPDNPVQKMIAQTVAEFSGVALEEMAMGVDGCGVPVFGIPVQAMALMYARLVAPPESFDGKTRAACEQIVSAMTAHPEMVGGTMDRLDTELMRVTDGRLISKVGAEGVYTVGVLPSKEWPRGLGLALKIEDGEDRRGRPTVVIEALRQLGILSTETLHALEPYSSFPVQNHLGEKVGEVRAVFELLREAKAL